MELTQKIIDGIKLPEGARADFRDSKVKGLVLRASSSVKSWSLEFRSPITGKNARIAIPAQSLNDARTQALAHKLTVQAGRDPNLEAKASLEARRIEHARMKTVEIALSDYEKVFVVGDKAHSRSERMARLRRSVKPFLDRQVASLTKGELVGRLDGILSESGPIARNRSQAEIGAWLSWLTEREHVPANVIAGVRKQEERGRERVLTDEELMALIKGTQDDKPFSGLVRVLLLTGMRRGEAASLQRRDLDFFMHTITVRAEVSKTRHERVIPMVEALVPMLTARAEGLSEEAYIFGDGTGFRHPFSGFGKPTDELRGEADWTLHDIRRTVATRLHEAGVDPLVVEDLLGHIVTRAGVAGIYNRSITLVKQRRALEAWSERLHALFGGNVVPLRAAG